MACTIGVVLPSCLLQGSKTRLANPRKPCEISTHFANPMRLHGRTLPGRQGYATIVSKAVGDSSSTSSARILKVIKDAWDESEDRVAIIGLCFAGIAAFWASTNLITAIDKLPLIPSALEFVGVLFSWWFIYRYLLFKPDREELAQIVKKPLSDVLGK